MRPKTRYDELKEQFRTFDRSYPQVYRLFCRFSFDLIERGFSHYSPIGVMARIRWTMDKPDESGASTFKVNNNYCPFYARKFLDDYPYYGRFYRLRHQSSHNQPATHLPPLGPEDYEYEEVTE